jgi:hypothetical protein
LADIAKSGIVTLATMHQPSKSVFDLVDDVILLAADGSLAFSGPTSEAVGFFAAPPFNTPFPEDKNPADVLIEAVSEQVHDDAPTDVDVIFVAATKVEQPKFQRIVEAYDQSDICARLSAEVQESQDNPRKAVALATPSFGTRISVLVEKELRLYWRDPGAYYYMFFVVAMFAIFLGTLYYDLPLTTSGLREVRGSMFLVIWMALYVKSHSLIAQSFPRYIRSLRATW